MLAAPGSLLRRVGIAGWSVLGLLLLAWVLGQVVVYLRVVLVPLALALFPALVLTPPTRWLKSRGVRPALAALIVIVGLLGVLAAVFATIGVALANQIGALGDTLRESYSDIREWLRSSALGLDLGPPEELGERLRRWLDSAEGLAVRPADLALTAVDVATGVLFGLAALFFYLKDGHGLVAWVADLLPAPWDRHIDVLGGRVWDTLAGYFRGQLLVALVDAVFIGLGLVILGVPLALPLSVLVFFGGFFPIVGAFASGLLAALVALADGGVAQALAVTAVVIAVQQLEGNVLEPLIVGRATRMHPLLVLVALALAGGLYGLLGAFLAVPAAASLLRVAEYAREVRTARREADDGERDQRPALAQGIDSR